MSSQTPPPGQPGKNVVFCSKCGQKNIPIYTFCEYCGTQLPVFRQPPESRQPEKFPGDEIKTINGGEPDNRTQSNDARIEAARMEAARIEAARTAAVQSAAVQSASARLSGLRAAIAKPADAKPVSVKPEPTKPISTKPISIKPAPLKPAPLKSASTKSSPIKPSPAKPAGSASKAAGGRIKNFVRFIPGKVPGKIFALTGAAVIMIIALVVFFALGQAMTNPVDVAKGYFEAVAGGHYEEAFAYLALESGDFVNKESYARYMQDKGGTIEDLAEYTIFENKRGNTAEVSDQEGSVGKTYTVRYAVQGVAAQESTTITLVKSGKKKLLFFSEYNVSSAGVLVYDYKISVLKGSAVSLDGIELQEGTPAADDDAANVDTYTIPLLFSGLHDLVIKNGLCEDYTEKLSVADKNNEKAVNKLTMKASLRKELAQKTQENYRSLFQGALKEERFTALGLTCTKDVEKTSRMENVYDNFVKAINKEGNSYENATFKSFSDQSNQIEINADMTYVCTMDVTIEYVRESLRDSNPLLPDWLAPYFEREVERRRVTQRHTIQLIYVFENDAWVLQGMHLGYD